MKTQIFKSFAEFTNREDKDVNGISEAFASKHPDFEKDNDTNKGCWNCLACRNCRNCWNCFDSVGRIRCVDFRNKETKKFEIIRKGKVTQLTRRTISKEYTETINALLDAATQFKIRNYYLDATYSIKRKKNDEPIIREEVSEFMAKNYIGLTVQLQTDEKGQPYELTIASSPYKGAETIIVSFD